MDVQELATETLKHFERFTRGDGDGSDDSPPLYKTNDPPDWVRDLCHDAHGDMFPDDWRYSFIVEALDALEEGNDTEDAYGSIEPDVYSSEITGWLHSRADRYGYVDEATAEGFIDEDADTLQRLMMGQLVEKLEVFHSVLASLEARIE